MDKRLQELLDHHEITQTLKEYCHGCDRGDEARWRASISTTASTTTGISRRRESNLPSS